MSARTRVISLKTAPKGWRNDPQFAYIGRMRNGRVNPCPSASGGLGNPFRVEDHGREECLALFRKFATDRVKYEPDYRDVVRSLAGKTLVCYCKPEPCHGDILAELADALASGVMTEGEA